MLLHVYSEHSHKTCSTDLHSHSQKNKLHYCFQYYSVCLPNSSFRPWVPDLNLNKSLKPMSDNPCKYFLHSKSSFNSLYYALNPLFLHIPECNLLLTKFLNALFIQDTASFEPSEVEVRSISLITSKTHFFHCFLFLPGILYLFQQSKNQYQN